MTVLTDPGAPQDEAPERFPWDTLSFALMLAAAMYPPLIPLAVAERIIRYSPTIVGGVLDLAGRVRGEPIALADTPTTRFLLPALDQLAAAPEEPVSPGALPATGATVPLPQSELLPDLLTTLRSALHLLVIGHTRGGKTCLLHEMATGWACQGAAVTVCDPDAAPGLWPGCRVVGAGDNFPAIAQALQITRKTVERRRQQRAQGQRQFAPAYLVIDEYQDIARQFEGAGALIESILRRGGKLNLHLVLGVQDKQVKTLGFEGQSSLRQNFSYVVEVRRLPNGARQATLAANDTGQTLTLPVPTLPDLERLIRPVPTELAYPTADADLASLLTGSGTSSRAQTDTESGENHPEPVPMEPAEPVVLPDTDTAEPAGTSGSGGSDDDTLIRQLLARGTSANKIAEALGGNRQATLARIRAIKDETNAIENERNETE